MLTAFALGLGEHVGANVVVETVFSWPGLGRLLVQAVASSDYPLAQGAFFLIAVVLVTMNFVADLLYGVLDPRVSHGSAAEIAATQRRARAARGVASLRALLRDPFTRGRRDDLRRLHLRRDLRRRDRDARPDRDPVPRQRTRRREPPAGRRVPARHHQSRPRHLLAARLRQRAARSSSALTAAVVVVAIGTLVGLLSGYFGGWIDSMLMRLADVALAIPFLPFVIVLAAFLRPSTWNVVLAVALLLWPNTARVIRSQVLTVRERAYVEAARVTGASDVAHPVRACRAEHPAAVLPLRLGRDRLGDPDRGRRQLPRLRRSVANLVGLHAAGRLRQSQALSRGSWHWFLPPGICIVLVVVAGFFISRGAEEVLFPKLRS